MKVFNVVLGLALAFIPLVVGEMKVIDASPPDLTPPIPIDVFHLIDQSGSVEEEAYVKYLNFAKNVSLSLGEQVGYDTQTTPGMRVSLIGFGCKMSSTRDQTEFFLLQETDENVIKETFNQAISEDYHPRYSRTCLRYAVEHVENAVLSPAVARSREPERKTVILLYSDGKNGDFAWPAISNSPLFNNEKLVEVFAVGVDNREVTRITESIVKDAQHVFTSLNEDTLKAVTSRLNNFVIDPYDLLVSLHEVSSSDVKNLGEVEEAEVCIGKQLRVAFEPVTKVPAIAREIETIDIMNQSVKETKLKLLSLYRSKSIDTATRVAFVKEVKESEDAEKLISDLKNVNKVSKAIESENNYLCVFETVKQSITTLATVTENSEDADVGLFCDIPTTLFKYQDYEELRVQIYRTGSADSLEQYELFQDVLKSFNVLVKWNVCSDVEVAVVPSSGCFEAVQEVSFKGETLTDLLPAVGWKAESAVCKIEELNRRFSPTVGTDGSVVCSFGSETVFYDYFLSFGREETQVLVSLETEDPLSGNLIQVEATADIEGRSDTKCISVSENNTDLCFVEEYKVDFDLDMNTALLTLPAFSQDHLKCRASNGIEANIKFSQNEDGSTFVECSISSLHLQKGSMLTLMLEANEMEANVLASSTPLAFQVTENCIQAEMVQTQPDCESSSGSLNGALTFLGQTIAALVEQNVELECVVVNADRRNTFIPVEYSEDSVSCSFENVKEHEVRLKIKDSSIRLFSTQVKSLERTCVDYHLLVDGQRSNLQEVCLSRNLAVNIVDGHIHYDTEIPITCLWSTGSREVSTTMQLDEENNNHLCVVPNSIELLQSINTQLSLVKGDSVLVEEAFVLPRLNSCVGVVDFGELEEFSMKSVESEEDLNAYPYNCARAQTEVSFDGTFLRNIVSRGTFLCVYRIDNRVVAVESAEFVDSVYQCYAQEDNGSVFSTIDNVELVYEEAELQFTVSSVTLDPSSRTICSTFVREQNCSDAASFLFTGPSINSVYTQAKDNTTWICELQLGNQTTFPSFSEQVSSPKETIVYGTRCSIDMNHYRFLDEAHDLDKMTAGSMTLKLIEEENTLLELTEQVNMTDLRACMLTAFVKPTNVEYKPFFSGFLGTGAMFIVGGSFFAYSRRRKQRAPIAKSHRSGTTVSSLTIEEDLVEALAEKEYLLFNSSGFEINDVVEVNLETSIDAHHKLGLILNKTLRGSKMTYEVKLLDEDNVIVADLHDSDLKLFRLRVGETVYVLDEEVEEQWNESKVLVFDQSNRTCDVRQKSNRINDVPLVCIRKHVQHNEEVPKKNTEIRVKVPHVSQMSHSLPMDLFGEPGILKKSSLKKLKNTNSARKNLNTSFNDKRVKFASNIPPPTYFSVPSESERLVKDKNFYDRESVLAYKNLGNGVYEVCVDISKGIGVCWVFDPIDGSILVGKFVETYSGSRGPLERTGKVQLKDKLVEIDGKCVDQYKSLSQVKDVIKRAKRKDKFVTFRLQQHSVRI